MEKVVYCLRRREGEDPDAFRERLVAQVAPRLTALGATGVEVHAADSAVEKAAGHRVESGLMLVPDALVSGWVASANAPLRAAYDDVVAAADPDWFGYVVSESVPLAGQDGGDSRADGYSQLAFLRRPDDTTVDEWFAHWHGTHTQVALETQATSRYVQNVVVRRLTPTTPDLAAIVEEVFPEAAMTDPDVFFDGQGDPGRQQANVERLFASVGAFLDFAAIDVVPMSRYFSPGPRGSSC
jgi:hypothetical protein